MVERTKYKVNILYVNTIIGLLLDPRFAGSNPAEDDGF
jgi:hypothetical protein